MSQPKPPRFIWRDWILSDPLDPDGCRRFGLRPDAVTYYWHGWLWLFDGRRMRALAPVNPQDLALDVQHRIARWLELGLMPHDEDDPEQVRKAQQTWQDLVYSAPNPW
ncbi:MAG: hypothetical protein N2Z75_07740 [Meiothermus sp.]|nr:hypothetical protein [Meiothermus sp.]